MASEVEICNTSLAMLGDEATVVSIDPPEGSAQADHCRIFYPMARDSLLELHDWNFATTRAPLAALVNDRTEWAHRYALPAQMLRARVVLAPGAPEQSEGKPFAVESLPDGTGVLYTNQHGAHLLYTRRVVDSTKFTPLFVEALAVLLASKLAGPVLKGAEGRKEAQAQAQMFYGVALPRATSSDAAQRRQTLDHVAPWIAAR